MTIEDQIKDDINREAPKISALSSGNLLLVKRYYHLIKNK